MQAVSRVFKGTLRLRNDEKNEDSRKRKRKSQEKGKGKP
jgi:hypothetical protein